MSFVPEDFPWSYLFVQKRAENLMKFVSPYLVNLGITHLIHLGESQFAL